MWNPKQNFNRRWLAYVTPPQIRYSFAYLTLRKSSRKWPRKMGGAKWTNRYKSAMHCARLCWNSVCRYTIGRVSEAKNDWRDKRPQVAMQRYFHFSSYNDNHYYYNVRESNVSGWWMVCLPCGSADWHDVQYNHTTSSWTNALITIIYYTQHWDYASIDTNMCTDVSFSSQDICCVASRWLSWAHWKARSGLSISVEWTFSLGVTAEALRAKINRKSAISLQRDQFDPKFQVEGVAPTNHFCMDS